MAKIRYENLKKLECPYCKQEFQPTGPAQVQCDICNKHILNVTAQVYRDIARFNKFGTYERVGQGGTNKSGKEHKQYKSGISYFHRVSKRIREERKYCERCGRNVSYAATGKWMYALHHKDHDRTNNEDSNFELLCKRCHQIHHDCTDHLPQYSL